MKTNILNFHRLVLLFKRYFAERSRPEVFYWSIMMIVFMFFRNNAAGMTPLILICGVIYASRFFKEINSSGNGVAYFMIPATQLEKLIVGITITSFYYFSMMMITYTLGNLLGTFLNNMLANMNLNINIFSNSPLQWVLFGFSDNAGIIGSGNNKFLSLLGTFLIGQSIYLLGSIYFKNNTFLLTFIAFIGFLFFISFLLIVEIQMLYGVTSFQFHAASFTDFGKIGGKILEVIMWLLAPFFWIVSYFRLTEKQV